MTCLGCKYLHECGAADEFERAARETGNRLWIYFPYHQCEDWEPQKTKELSDLEIEYIEALYGPGGQEGSLEGYMEQWDENQN